MEMCALNGSKEIGIGLVVRSPLARCTIICSVDENNVLSYVCKLVRDYRCYDPEIVDKTSNLRIFYENNFKYSNILEAPIYRVSNIALP